MKTILLLALALTLSACGLTPKQLQALEGAMCTKTSGYGISNTTSIVAGSKNAGVSVNGENCSIQVVGK
jgi:hypothetical protein